jgi:hypothetical protein
MSRPICAVESKRDLSSQRLADGVRKNPLHFFIYCARAVSCDGLRADFFFEIAALSEYEYNCVYDAFHILERRRFSFMRVD